MLKFWEAIYNVSVNAYGRAVKLAQNFIPKAKDWTDGRKQIELQLANLPSQKPIIWLHASSVGEFEQGLPVLEQLKVALPNHAFLISFFSPSGFKQLHKTPHADAVCYLPLDRKSYIKIFVERVNPKVFLVVKYEFWFNLFEQLHLKNIPIFIISANFRPQQPFFKGISKKFWLQMLQYVRFFYVQNQRSANLLDSLGLKNYLISFDTRYDRVLAIAQQPFACNELVTIASERPILVAGSTWPDDERFLRQLLPFLPKNMVILIAPHNVDSNSANRISNTFGDNQTAVWENHFPAFGLNKRILVVNKTGILAKLYRFGNVAWVGGGLHSEIHNVLEPAAYGIPVAFGPGHQKFDEATELIENKLAFASNNPEAVAKWFDQRLAIANEHNLASEVFFREHAGATQRIVQHLLQNI